MEEVGHMKQFLLLFCIALVAGAVKTASADVGDPWYVCTVTSPHINSPGEASVGTRQRERYKMLSMLRMQTAFGILKLFPRAAIALRIFQILNNGLKFQSRVEQSFG